MPNVTWMLFFKCMYVCMFVYKDLYHIMYYTAELKKKNMPEEMPWV